MYELDDSVKVEFSHNPFSMPQGGLEALETKAPLDILAYQYDIVCNGVELSSGAIRNHLPEVMYKAFAIAGYTQEQRSEEHTSELQSLMRISYAVFCLKKKKHKKQRKRQQNREERHCYKEQK